MDVATPPSVASCSVSVKSFYLLAQRGSLTLRAIFICSRQCLEGFVDVSFYYVNGHVVAISYFKAGARADYEAS